MLAHMEMAAFYFCQHHMKLAMQVLQIQEFEFHQWNANLLWPGTCRVANQSPELIQNAELNSGAWQVDCCCHLHQDRCAYSEDLELCSFTA
jgi:hypothetical protein